MTTQINVKAHVGSQFSQVTVPIPTLRYLDSFIRLNKSAKDMLGLEVFPNAKEITESYAAHQAVFHKLGISHEFLKRLNPVIVVVGDGCTPRTGVTFAFKSPFQVESLDPNNRWINDGRVDRLNVHTKTLQQYVDSGLADFDRPVILVGVHSHVPEKELMNFHNVVGNKLFAIVEIPCCFPQQYIKAFGEPTKEYIDWGIHSEKRTVRIWKFKK